MTRKHGAGFFTSTHQRPLMKCSVFRKYIYNQKRAVCKQVELLIAVMDEGVGAQSSMRFRRPPTAEGGCLQLNLRKKD
ncbi:hypothetical protein NQZ68_027433 [Dissostichus eleginoides]|nr:hypothetical protein NQZ68_027433 [Dissostichus eleginoides]